MHRLPRWLHTLQLRLSCRSRTAVSAQQDIALRRTLPLVDTSFQDVFTRALKSGKFVSGICQLSSVTGTVRQTIHAVFGFGLWSHV